MVRDLQIMLLKLGWWFANEFNILRFANEFKLLTNRSNESDSNDGIHI
jgi:hypothetical protein